MTIQIKATEQYFPVVLFIMLYKVVFYVLTFWPVQMKVKYLKLSYGLIMLFKAVISGRFLDQKFLRVAGIQTEMHLAQYFPQAGNCSILWDAVRCKANSTRHNLIKKQRLLVIESRERNKIPNKKEGHPEVL